MNPEIKGEWHVQGTTFPMWKKGNRLNPRFRYTPLEAGRWKDEVFFEKTDGKTAVIKGTDRLLGENPLRFKWRGSGLLAIAVSRWQVDYVSPGNNWMLISFEKTLFTPAGADVISRNKTFSETEKQHALAEVQKRFPGLSKDWAWL